MAALKTGGMMRCNVKLRFATLNSEVPCDLHEERDFSSLAAVLGWMQREYGEYAAWWTMAILAEQRAADVREFQDDLEEVLAWDWQVITMEMNDKCPEYEKLGCYEFTIHKIDEDDPIEDD